jgi:TPR repeat protein
MLSSMDKSAQNELPPPPQPTGPETAPPDAPAGDAESQFDQGVKFASGQGAAQDYAQAAACYRKAADQSHPLAQFNLGIMYAEGHGMAPDAAESLVWFGRSARLGDAGAQFKMGDNCYRASLWQMPPDDAESRIEAYKWYRLAAAQGYKGSEASFSSLSLKMTWEDVAASNARVAAFGKG